ncbi:MAG TPA: glycosyltransferase family 2 protein [Candidatus Bathyarchaeia archaeon]|nr:glycosyltransferase family 2 protein [Candidatus Bathyarchaeia archaeon]
MKNTCIILVNFNCGNQILSCLGLLIKEEVKIIVIDNASTDGSLERIIERFSSSVIVLKNSVNKGFAVAANIGIRRALRLHFKNIILLNPDTNFKEGFSKRLIQNPADIVSPVIKYIFNGKAVYDLGGRVNYILGRTKHKRFRSIFKPQVIDYVSGCCMKIKSKVFFKIGFLDEKFFLYWEDVDFCIRARRANLTIDIELGVVIFHKLKYIVDKPWNSVYYLLKGNLRFINKYIVWKNRIFAYSYLLFLLFKITYNKLLCSLGLY